MAFILNPINKCYSRSFSSLNEIKEEFKFQKILDKYITLDSVFQAIERAKRIVEHNRDQEKISEEYKKIQFYHDNLDTTVHDVVQLIFEVCGVKWISLKREAQSPSKGTELSSDFSKLELLYYILLKRQ